MDIATFINNYGSELPAEEKTLLRAADAYYKNYFDNVLFGTVDDKTDVLWRVIADIRVYSADGGSADGSRGSYFIKIPSGDNGAPRIPVAGISGWENSTFLIYDSKLGLVHELGHVILGLLGITHPGGPSSELMLAALASVGRDAIASADRSSPDYFLQVARKVRQIFGLSESTSQNPAKPDPNYVTKPDINILTAQIRTNLLSRASEPDGSYENIFNSMGRDFYRLAGLEQVPSAYRVGYIAHAGLSGLPDPDKHWQTYGEGASEGAPGRLETLIKNSTTNGPGVAWLGNQYANVMTTGKGKDYLDGGKGNDILDGGEGDDVIYGGAGDDRITGGPGNDVLNGGKGNDTYVINAGDGVDHIIDKEGTNRLILNGQVVGIGLKQQDGTYKSPDGKITYTLNSPLTITNGSGASVVFDDFQDGDFGIRLRDLSALPETTHELIGDRRFKDFDSRPDAPYETGQAMLNPGFDLRTWAEQLSYPSVQITPIAAVYTDINGKTQFIYPEILGSTKIPDGGYTTVGNPATYLNYLYPADIVPLGSGAYYTLGADGIVHQFDPYTFDNTSPLDSYFDQSPYSVLHPRLPGTVVTDPDKPDPGRWDTLPGGAENDHIVGGDGFDLIFGRGGDDWIEAGVDNPDPTFGGDLDYVNGGDGNDLIEGGAHSDILIGGAGKDRIFAGTRDDLFTINQPGQVATTRRDWLAGGDGDDVLIGALGNEGFSGGGGDDWIIAGAGDDNILGDSDYIAQSNLWSVDEATTPGYRTFLGTIQAINPSAGGKDIIYAGDGNDWVIGEWGSDELYGEAGDDYLLGDSIDIPFADHGDDLMDGGEGDDTLVGDGGSDSLYGGSGDDVLSGDSAGLPSEAHGQDYLDGGEGSDQLIGGGGEDTLYGGDGDDFLYGDSSDTDPEYQKNDLLFGEAGNDELVGSGGDDILFGGTGDDWLYGDATGLETAYHGDDVLSGDVGNDYLVGAGGKDFLSGGEGDDQIFGDVWDIAGNAHASDILTGGSGNDVLIGGGDADELYGDDGNDYLLGDDNGLSFAYHQGDFLEGGAGNDTLYGMGGDDFLYGGDGTDWLFGDTGNDTVSGGDGDDWLYAGGGNDFLEGDAGWDTYVFGRGDGSDIIADAGDNTLFFNFGLGIYDLDLFVGSLGIRIRGTNDEIHIAGFDPDDPYANAAITRFEYANGHVQTLEEFLAQGFDIEGTSEDDILIGTALTDRLNGYAGNDILIGKAGSDFLSGGTGSDTADGGDGDDLVAGEEGDDQLTGGAGQDVLNGGEGNDALDGGEGHDRLLGGIGDDALLGGDGSDVLDGGAGADSMIGGAGNDEYHIDSAADVILENPDGNLVDRVYSSVDYSLADNVEELLLEGGALIGTGNALDNVVSGTVSDNLLIGLGGNDTVRGWEGNDQLLGGDGDDSLYGGIGDDHLEGGAGNDTLYGDEGSNHLFGGDGNDDLHGGSASDILDGGAGQDQMQGADGDDIYYVDDEQDSATETGDVIDRTPITLPDGSTRYGTVLATGGNDTVFSSVSHRMSSFVENLYLTGSDPIHGYGSLFARQITGNDAGNDLYAYRLNGRADNIGGSPVAMSAMPNQGIQERLLDRALLAFYRGDVNPNRPPFGQRYNIEIRAGMGVTLEGGAGNDRLFGDLDNDTLLGGAGDDLLYGLGGADLMIGGAGDDTYIVDGYMGVTASFADANIRYLDYGGDTVFEYADGGNDTVISGINYTLGDNVENLILSGDTGAYDQDVDFYGSGFSRQGYATFGAGNDLDNRILGNDRSVRLEGRGGNDYLEGGSGSDFLDGGAGVDVMYGGGGDDYYVVDTLDDVIIELEPNPWFGGFDMVEAGFNYTLGNNLENLQLTGTDDLIGVGNELDNQIFGNDGNNRLYGHGGNDLLDGGLGADTMFGGDGDDQYYVDNAGDLTDETDGGGIDEVFASVTHAIGTDIENLALIGDEPIDGTGNELDNRITGNWASNVLSGLGGNDLLDGGQGADTLIGGAGDDSYVVDDEGDVVVEDTDSGIDSVVSSARYVLSANVENLRLTGDGYIDGFGNGLNNTLIGNDYGNRLTGEGGDDWIDGAGGDDWLQGGEGNDYLYGGDDAVIYPYGQGEGCDEEEGDCGGECYVTPNDDVLDGGAGDDVLDGGSGNDVLYGGAGNDTLFGGDDGLPAGICGGYVCGEEGCYYIGGGEGWDNGYFANPNDDQLFGGAGADILIGGSGNDLLDGGTELDTMAGGTGDDVYYVDGYAEIITVPTTGGGGDTDPGTGGGSCEPGDIKDHGNEGLGNGEDPPPPGHDGNWNDGEETSPGHPGRRQGGKPAESSSHDSQDHSGSSGHDHDGDDGDHDRHSGGCDHTDPALCDVDPIAIPGMAGAGDPSTIVIWHTDTVEEFAEEGYDVVYSSVTFALPDNVEELILVGTGAIDATGNSAENYLGGNDAGNVLSSLGGDDTLYGRGGNDRLDGGNGADWMDGGTGDDVYVVDDAGDRAIENADAGNDTVLSSVDSTLGDHVENLVLTGTAAVNATGNDSDNLLVGNDAANVLMGLAGNDSLYGRGGNDVLDGGIGNDIYYITVNDGIDTLIDIDGDDTLVLGNCITPERVSVRYATDSQGRAIASLRLLAADGCESETEGVNIVLNPDGSLPIERVRFADGTVTTLDTLVVRSLTHTGTDKSDRIATGRDDDTIYALGGNDSVNAGAGHDTLYGGKGKDVLCGRGGNDRLFGEEGDDRLYGGCGDDVLDGGNGENRLVGGAGGDLLLLGSGENEIYLGLGDGWDTVRSVDAGSNDCPDKKDDADNEIHFGEGIARERLWFERAGDDLLVRVLGTSDGMTIEDWYTTSHKPIEEFQTGDGSELEARQVELLVQAMAQFSPNLSADGSLPVDQQQGLNVVIAAAWERG